MPAPFSYAPRLAGVPVLWNIMKIDIVSVFPEYFEVLNLSLLGKAQEKGLVEVTAHNLRDWTHDVHHSVDDTPVGGGAGMVMKPEEFPKGYFVPGRMAMTCCAEDMTFLGFACVYDKIDLYQERGRGRTGGIGDRNRRKCRYRSGDRPSGADLPESVRSPVHPAGRDGAEPRQPSAVRLRPLRRLRRAYSAVLPCAGRRRA